MPISVQCPGCKKKLTGKDELAGKRVKCPGCGHAVLIPAAQPAPQPKATKPAPQKLPVPNKADGITSPSPKKPPAAKKDDVVAAPVPASLERRIRWPWYAGGAAAVCLVAGLVFLLMPSKGRNASGDERPVLADASPAVVQPGNGAGEVDTRDLLTEGPGDLALTYDVVHTDTTKHRGKRVTWAFTPCSSEGKRMLCALNRQEAMGPRHHGLYVVEFASDHEAGAVFRAAAFKPGSTITGTIAGNVDQFLVVQGGDGVAQNDVPKVTVPLLLYPAHTIGDSNAGNGKGDLAKLNGRWKVVSADEGGSPRSEWAGGTFTILDDKIVLSNAVGTSFTKIELRIAEIRTRSSPGVIVFENAKEWIYLLEGDSLKFAANLVENKAPAGFPERSMPGIAVYTLRRIEKGDGSETAPAAVKVPATPRQKIPLALPQPKSPPLEAKGDPKKTSLSPMMGGNFPKKSQTTPEKSKESEAGTEEIWPKKARAQYFEKPADLWAVFLTDAEKLPKGGPRAPWTRLLPTATKKLTVGVVFYREPAAATFSVRVLSKSGEVKLAETKQDFLMINSTYIRYVDLVPEKGTFAEGDYRAEVSINGKKIALVKWVIGKGSRDAAKPLTQREKLLLGKWREAKNSAELGGGRFWGDMKFSDDGNLIITVKDTKTNKPAFLWATYKLLDDSTLEISIEGTSHDRVDIPGWGARELDMVRALLDEKPYTMKVSFAVSAKELTFAGVNYVRVEPGATGTP